MKISNKAIIECIFEYNNLKRYIDNSDIELSDGVILPDKKYIKLYYHYINSTSYAFRIDARCCTMSNKSDCEIIKKSITEQFISKNIKANIKISSIVCLPGKLYTINNYRFCNIYESLNGDMIKTKYHILICDKCGLIDYHMKNRRYQNICESCIGQSKNQKLKDAQLIFELMRQ